MPSTRLLWFGVPDAAFYVAIVDIGAELSPGYIHVVQPIGSLYQAGAVLGPPIAITALDSESRRLVTRAPRAGCANSTHAPL